MNWDHARFFLAVARSGQILAAARQLGVDHATVSRRISALEEALRTKLLERRTAGCTLTSAGERFLAIAERVESEMLQAEAEVSAADLELEGTVRVGAPDGLGNYFLASELAQLARQHPRLTIQLVPLPRSFSLSKREADIAVTIDRPSRGRVVVKKLADYDLHVYASRRHLETFGPISCVADLADRCLVTYVEDLLYSAALDYAEELRRHMPIRYECASVAAQLEAVLSGQSIGILHGYAARKYPELVPVLPEMSFQRTYWITAHEDVRDLRRVAVVHEFIARRVEEQRPLFMAR
ncbi:LysR family transcriptional regulator [Alkalilimnicola ehrlichii]|uniref:LysR family transcriptional regulator n=1 Tax=Alkalilimnicola ehrlichii TaxID=351052 RepID=A0A3E0WZB3_9GAMM|nr:LysR family transcriptional regulator [Alkalilimnicola ehrlichii]RFA30790.1 LysR family transcriptional regulator [Alkalilimnicola ehrlichii]RFA38368.1 LysR family transcriptional regulator [Alkalilimnicola ehrlichii]